MENVIQQKKDQVGDFLRRPDCRFCQSRDMVTILDFGNVPLAGGFLKESDFILLRPPTDIAADDISRVIGKTVKRNLQKDEAIAWKDLA